MNVIHSHFASFLEPVRGNVIHDLDDFTAETLKITYVVPESDLDIDKIEVAV
jgi:hypothetical protein